ncbi:MAG: hypothetical protein JWP35_1640 [Caulobacter sp.]|nr:hypothetical protein [Caulobacter sp.]
MAPLRRATALAAVLGLLALGPGGPARAQAATSAEGDYLTEAQSGVDEVKGAESYYNNDDRQSACRIINDARHHLYAAIGKYDAARAEAEADTSVSADERAENLNQLAGVQEGLVSLRDRSLNDWQVMC